jgi:hypothetical protein
MRISLPERTGGGLGNLRRRVQCGDRSGDRSAGAELHFSRRRQRRTAVHLGKITPNPDNAEDTTPEDFKVTIDKIELYEISGEETQVPVYTSEFAAGEGVAVTQ